MTATPAPVRFRAVTREVEPGRDVLTTFDADGFAWVHNGRRIAASGVVARVAPRDVATTLEAIDVDDAIEDVGSGPIAVGGLLALVRSPALAAHAAADRVHGSGCVSPISLGSSSSRSTRMLSFSRTMPTIS